MPDAIEILMQDMYSQDAHGKPEGNQKANLRLVRTYNRRMVLNYVREYGPITRVEVARRTGLSRATVSSIMDVLLREGFVSEGDYLSASPEGGRRAILVHFNADIGYVIGIEVEQTRLTILLTDLSARIITRQSKPFELERGPEVCLPQLIAEVRAFVAAAAVSWERIIGIGLGIPGPLDAERRKISPPGMPAWNEVDTWSILHDAFKVPLYMDNDANMGAVGETRYGAGRECTELAYVIARVGIGAGLIIHGQIYRGHGGSAGELGHITIDENGLTCVCGKRGCLETVAGSRAIVEDALSGRSLARLTGESLSAEQSIDPSGVDISAIIERAQANDAASRAAVEQAGEHIGVAVGSLLNLFNPLAVVIDGSIARAGELFLTPLRRAAIASSLPAAWHGTRVVPSELNGNAVALGGVFTVLNAAFATPTLSNIPLRGRNESIPV